MSLKILIVEDERIIAEDIRSMIESLGYRVIDIVDNGDMALELLAQEPADLVLMDIKIRGPMNGIETARQIYFRFDVPVIYLTAYADESTLKRIKETVAYGFIVKPASRQTIQGTIELAIYKHNMDCQLRERDERFEHLNRVLRAIRNVNQLIIKEMDRDRLLQGICNSLTETLGYQKTWIAVVDADNAPIHFGQAGFEETVNGFGRLFADGNWVRCAELAIEKPGLIIMNPRQECKKCRLYDDEKEYSRFSTRLEYGGKIYGLFSVAVPIRFVEDPEERELFRELACDIVFALYRIELEEKKQYAETLVEARERTLSTLMDNLPGMAYRCLADENWTMKFVSTGCRSLTGYWPDDLVDNQRFSYEEIIHPDDRDSVRDQVLNPVGENGQYELTYRIMTASGEIRWVWERGCFTGEKEGEHKILEGVIHDITEQKEAEEYLRQSEEKYRVLVENMTDAVFMVDCEKKVLSVNQSAARLLQKNADQVIGKTIFDLFPKELADNYHASIGHVFHSGKPLVVERKSLFANREIWLVASLSPIKDKNGNVIAVIGVSRDVSERKYAEQKLRESEARYRAIVEDQHEYIERWLPDGAITFVNESFCKSSGKTADEWLGTNIFDTLGESDRKRLKKKLRGLTPEAPFETDAYEEVLADGSHRWTEWTDRALFDENGKIREIQSVGRDITRRKIAEEILRHEKELLAKITETSPIGITVVNSDGQIVFANKQAEEILHLSKDEISQRQYNAPVWKITDYEGRHFPDKELPFNQVKKDRKSIFNIRHAIEWPNGQRRLLLIHASPMFDPNGRFEAMVASVEDVTDAIHAEEEKRKHRDAYERLFNTMIDGYALHEIICDKKGKPIDYRFLDINPAFERMTGLKKEKVVGKTVFEVLPGTEPYWIDRYGKVALSGESVQFEDFSQELDKYFEVMAFSPQKGQFVVVFVDITRRKKAEQTLEKHRQELRNLSSKLIHTQEDKRKHLARELHDEMGQLLTGIKLNVAAIEKKLEGQVSEPIRTLIAETDSLANNLLEQMHGIALELRPNMLDDLGLAPTLRWYVKQGQKRWSFAVRLDIADLKERLSPAYETALYRIIQESINNAARHAKPETVTVRINIRDNTLKLSIHDNGSGFDRAEIKGLPAAEQGIGLIGIHERVSELGGKLNVQSRPGKGTTIDVRLPLAKSRKKS